MNGDDTNPGKTEETQGKVQGLYLGDRGILPLDTRRALVRLLSGPFVDAERHSLLWSVVLRDEDILRSRLSDLFLDLIVDRDSRVAFVRQADTGETDTPGLLRRMRLKFIDSVLLLHLRQLLTQAESGGDRAVVSDAEILEYMRLYEKSASTDKAGFQKKVAAAAKKLRDNEILQRIRGSEDRYEISPVLKLVFSADEVNSLNMTYAGLAQEEGAAEEGGEELVEGEEEE